MFTLIMIAGMWLFVLTCLYVRNSGTYPSSADIEDNLWGKTAHWIHLHVYTCAWWCIAVCALHFSTHIRANNLPSRCNDCIVCIPKCYKSHAYRNDKPRPSKHLPPPCLQELNMDYAIYDGKKINQKREFSLITLISPCTCVSHMVRSFLPDPVGATFDRVHKRPVCHIACLINNSNQLTHLLKAIWELKWPFIKLIDSPSPNNA